MGEVYLLPFYKIYMYRSYKYLFIYLFLIFVSLDQLIFCIKYPGNLVRYKTLQLFLLLSFFSYYSVENAKYMFSIFRVIFFYFIFGLSR